MTWPQPRHWLAAVAIGLLLGFMGALEPFTSVWYSRPYANKFAAMLPILGRWSVLLVGASCLTLLGFTLLRELDRRGRLRPWHYAAMTVLVVAINAVTCDPLAFALLRWSHVALGLPWRPFFMHMSWWGGQQMLWAMGMPSVLIMVGMASFAFAYNTRARRNAAALANAQLRLTEAERRVLAEQLHGAQAAIEPDFLFATLESMAACSAAEPSRAARLLDALIRFLRAALPAGAEQACTLGLQARLIQAYLEIEALRSGERLQGRVDLPERLRDRPFAPLLLLPLVHDAIERGARRVTLNVSSASGRLRLDVEDDGPGTAAAALHVELSRRLQLLYGDAAVLQARPGQGVRLEINDREETP
jgi:hypothetical protein